MNTKMSTNDVNICEGERRFNAYLTMIEDIYHVHGYALADLVGIKRTTWTRNMNAPWYQRKTSFISALAGLVGVPLDWFFPDEL